MPTRTRSVAALAAAAACAIPLFVSLGTSVRPVERGSLGVEERASGIPAALRGRWAVELDGTFYLLRIGLRTSNPQRLLDHDEIAFEVLPYEGPIELEDAFLAFDGTTCAYRTRPGAPFVPGNGLTLLRSVGCAHPEGMPTGSMMLTLRLRSEGRAALRAAVRTAADTPDGAVVISPFGLPTSPGVLIAHGTLGRRVANLPTARRLALLAYVWNLSPSGAWIVVVLLGAAAAIAGTVLLSRRPATAAFLAALALGLAYAVVVPPFQAADEPNHFLTLAAALERPELAAEAAAWARRAHFEELRTVGRPFTPADIDRPGQPWIDVSAPDPARGAGALPLWRLLTPVLRHASAPRVLLTVRLFHALLFAAAAGLFVLVVARLTDAQRPELLAIPIFLVPTLPYFGMHLSNYAPLVSLYILFAAGAAAACWDGPRSHLAAPLLGLAVTVGMALSRSAVPLGGLAAGIAIARLALGDRQGRWQAALKFWLLLTITSIVGLSLANLAYPEGPERAIIRYDVAHGRLAWLLHNPWWLIVPGAALAGVEIGVSILARRLAAPSRTRSVAVAAAGYAAAVALAGWIVASPWIRQPIVIPLERIRVTPLDETVREILPALVAWPRFGHPDWLSSTTFWGGFGWLETLLPEGLVSALAGASGLALAGLLAWIGRRRSGRAGFWLGCAASGYVVSAIAYAFTARLIFTDVHGRYLLGLYLAALVVAWSSVARWTQDRSAGTTGFVTAIAAACSLLLHTWTLSYLLSRYY